MTHFKSNSNGSRRGRRPAVAPHAAAGAGPGRPAKRAEEEPGKTGSDAISARIHAVVARIPAGRVATYGQVAALAGLPGRARQVGHALQALAEGSRLPWQRVINAQGRVSPRGGGWNEGFQRFLLEEEGVVFSASGRVDLDRFGWRPAGPARRTRARQKD